MYGENYYGGQEYGGRRDDSIIAVIVAGTKSVILTTKNIIKSVLDSQAPIKSVLTTRENKTTL